MSEWKNKFLLKLNQIYGLEEGFKVQMILLPAFIKDFSGMLLKAPEGSLVAEEYGSEDRKVTLRLEGIRQAGSLFVTRVRVNGEELIVPGEKQEL